MIRGNGSGLPLVVMLASVGCATIAVFGALIFNCPEGWLIEHCWAEANVERVSCVLLFWHVIVIIIIMVMVMVMVIISHVVLWRALVILCSLILLAVEVRRPRLTVAILLKVRQQLTKLGFHGSNVRIALRLLPMRGCNLFGNLNWFDVGNIRDLAKLLQQIKTLFELTVTSEIWRFPAIRRSSCSLLEED
jgi:hypothetical protein